MAAAAVRDGEDVLPARDAFGGHFDFDVQGRGDGGLRSAM